MPVISDLNHLIGRGDVSLLDLIKATSGYDLVMLERLLDLVAFINNLPDPGEHPVWISLGNSPGGSFKLDPRKAIQGLASPGDEMSLIDPASLKELGKLTSDELRNRLLNPPQPPGTATTTTSVVSKTTFEQGGLTFPFVQQPMQIFGMLLGKDAVLVRYDFGTMRGTAGFSRVYRFWVGPIPMSVTLAGSATLTGRFAMGYDTYGLRQVLNGASASRLLDGIFIDDLDASGRDVPEVEFIGEFRASAAVDAVIVSAGVRGGITLTVGLDLDDRPEEDGRLRIEEIVNRLSNPWCLFQVKGNLDAWFSAYVKLDFFLFSKEWTWEVARTTLLDFSAECDPPKPVLARFDTTKVDGKNVPALILHIGTQASRRNINRTLEDEKITVRQLKADGTLFSVSGFGIQQFYTTTVGALIGPNAAGGDDEISLLGGVDDSTRTLTATTTSTTTDFTAKAIITGGEGNDQIRTGEGDDAIYGGGGNDNINASGGDDTVYGEGGDDAIDASVGDDTVHGGPGNDLYQRRPWLGSSSRG